MSNFDYLITCAGWEDRFVGGLENVIQSHNIGKIIVFRIHEFSEKTESNVAKAKTIVNDDCIREIEISLLDDVKTWKIINNVFENICTSPETICIDLTTMPRFLIWFIIHFSELYNNRFECVYFKPDHYPECDWLTSDAEKPRLVFKRSGQHLPDQSTILIIQTGFDIERVNQLIYSYEPEKVFLGVQVGEQFDNALKNLKKHKEQLKYQELDFFELDAYSGDYGYSSIENIVLNNKDTHNIILSSFGPKPASLAMFKINKNYPEVGLSYVLVKNYNACYSHGIDKENAVSIESGYL